MISALRIRIFWKGFVRSIGNDTGIDNKKDHPERDGLFLCVSYSAAGVSRISSTRESTGTSITGASAGASSAPKALM